MFWKAEGALEKFYPNEMGHRPWAKWGVGLNLKTQNNNNNNKKKKKKKKKKKNLKKIKKYY